MKPLIFIYSHDNIFNAVKMESSYLAERRFDDTGEGLFEQLVFDEEYLIFFRELFFEAQAEVTSALSGYMKDVPVHPGYFETQDFSKSRDYKLFLSMPDEWNFHLTEPVDIKIKEYLVAYILYRWLETKSPNDAASYLQRAKSVLKDIKELLDKRTRPTRRAHGYWGV